MAKNEEIVTILEHFQLLFLLLVLLNGENAFILGYFKGKCYGFAWQGFGSGGAVGLASVRSCEKLPPCLLKPGPAGSKTDPPLAKAKPSSEGGSASGITYLRRGSKKPAVNQQ